MLCHILAWPGLQGDFSFLFPSFFVFCGWNNVISTKMDWSYFGVYGNDLHPPPSQNGYIVFGTDLFSTFHFEKVTEHFRGQFHFSARRPASMSPPPQWLSLFTQLRYSDRTAGWPTPAAQRPLRDLWLSSDHLHSPFHLWFCVCVCLHTHTAGLHSGRSNCRSMYSAVAVLNCPAASGLQSLTGPMCFVLLVVPNSALLYHTTIL